MLELEVRGIHDAHTLQWEYIKLYNLLDTVAHGECL
uniref:Uncharacterized protein n=1 Tax=Triatoma infestans TaxID=30076 RepID=A0A170XSJ9_TRIIF